MGKFGNTAAELGEPAAPCFGPIDRNEPWHGENEFAALGKKVPQFRKSAADGHMKDMGFTDAEQRYNVISTMSGHIARDDPHMALESAMSGGCDATACYRLLSVLLTAQQPQEQSQ